MEFPEAAGKVSGRKCSLIEENLANYFKGFFKLTFASSSSLSPDRQSSHPTICVSHSVLLIPLCPAAARTAIRR
jgi:hypothetical protein